MRLGFRRSGVCACGSEAQKLRMVTVCRVHGVEFTGGLPQA